VKYFPRLAGEPGRRKESRPGAERCRTTSGRSGSAVRRVIARRCALPRRSFRSMASFPYPSASSFPLALRHPTLSRSQARGGSWRSSRARHHPAAAPAAAETPGSSTSRGSRRWICHAGTVENSNWENKPLIQKPGAYEAQARANEGSDAIEPRQIAHVGEKDLGHCDQQHCEGPVANADAPAADPERQKQPGEPEPGSALRSAFSAAVWFRTCQNPAIPRTALIMK
jgi:hypothetical protein